MKTTSKKSFSEGMCLFIFACAVILALTLIGLFGARTAHASAVPADLRPVLYQALDSNATSDYSIGKGGCVALSQQSFGACFDDAGGRFSIIDGEKTHHAHSPMLALSLTAFGRGAELKPILAVRPAISGNRVSYVHAGITEWWRVLPLGFEQGFTVSKRPGGKGDLVIELAANRSAEQRDGGLAWGKLHYGHLVVTDARGAIVPATLKTVGKRIRIAVNDCHAAYPLTVDPLVWLQQKVVAKDGGAYENFATSFALSGTTALIGVPHATVGTNQLQGAVYVFSDEDGTWTQTQKLTATDGAGGDNFGISIALDGTTALIGAYDATVGNVPYLSQGAAYIFDEKDGTWSQTQKLTASDGTPYAGFGLTVGLAGTTAVVGAYSQTVGNNVYQGAAYVFTDENGAWTQKQELVSSDGVTYDSFSNSLAFDGQTLLIGASNSAVGANPYQGKVYAFKDTGGSWAQAQILVAADGAANQYFGNAIALDGATALIGDSGATVGDNAYQGAAYVFTNANGTWTQAQKLTAGDGASSDGFGWAVALDGAKALIGAPNAAIGSNGYQGASYLFSDSGGSWSEVRKLTAADGGAGDGFGDWVALDGTTALIGAYNATIGENFAQGAAYFLGQTDLGLAVSAPGVVNPGAVYTSQIIATNSTSAASPGVSIVTPVPVEASLVSAAATQGTCSANPGLVTCNFGSVGGNAGTATANIKLKVIHIAPAHIENMANVVGATPAISASAPTEVVAHEPPVASDGTLDTGVNQPASGTLEASSPEGEPLVFRIVIQPLHGTIKLNDVAKGSYTYTPDQGSAGKDVFAFVANDGHADSNVARVAVTIKDQAPVAKDGSVSTDKNKPVDGQLQASDPDQGQMLSYLLVSPPDHGTVSVEATSGKFTYTPDVGYVGSDQFSFKVSDSYQDSNTASVAVTVKSTGGGGGGSGSPLGLGVLALAGLLVALRRRRG